MISKKLLLSTTILGAVGAINFVSQPNVHADSINSASTNQTTVSSAPVSDATTAAQTSAPSSAVSSAPSSAVSSAPSSAVSSAPSSAVSSAPSSAVSSAPSSAVSSAPSSAVSSAPSSAVSSAPSSAVSSAPSSDSSSDNGTALGVQLDNKPGTPKDDHVDAQPARTNVSTNANQVPSNNTSTSVSNHANSMPTANVSTKTANPAATSSNSSTTLSDKPAAKRVHARHHKARHATNYYRAPKALRSHTNVSTKSTYRASTIQHQTAAPEDPATAYDYTNNVTEAGESPWETIPGNISEHQKLYDGNVIYYDDQTNKSMDPQAVAASVNNWNSLGIVKLVPNDGTHQTGIVISDGYDPYDKGTAYAETTVPAYGDGTISQAHVYIDGATDGTSMQQHINVVTHEMGHALGFAHDESKYYSADGTRYTTHIMYSGQTDKMLPVSTKEARALAEHYADQL